MLRHLIDSDARLAARVEDRTQRFCNQEAARHKDNCPNLGEELSLYMCHPSQPLSSFIAAYLDENFLRCVMWWRKDGVEPLPRKVFEATKVSREVCLFQLKILHLITSEECAQLRADELAARLEAFQKSWRSLQHEVDQGGWARFFLETGCPSDVRDRILWDTGSWVNECVKRSNARGDKYRLSGGAGGGGVGRGGGWGGSDGERGGGGWGRGRGRFY